MEIGKRRIIQSWETHMYIKLLIRNDNYRRDEKREQKIDIESVRTNSLGRPKGKEQRKNI